MRKTVVFITIFLVGIFTICANCTPLHELDDSTQTITILLWDVSGSNGNTIEMNDEAQRIVYERLTEYIVKPNDAVKVCNIGMQSASTSAIKTFRVKEFKPKKVPANAAPRLEKKINFFNASGQDKLIRRSIEESLDFAHGLDRNEPSTAVYQALLWVSRICQAHPESRIRLVFVSDMVETNFTNTLMNYLDVTNHTGFVEQAITDARKAKSEMGLNGFNHHIESIEVFIPAEFSTLDTNKRVIEYWQAVFKELELPFFAILN